MKKNILKTILILATSSLLCYVPASLAENEAATAKDEDTLCIVKTFDIEEVGAACKVGDKLGYTPESFGNEQLPVMFVSLNCDLDRGVVWTNGGVSCYYRPVTHIRTNNR